MICNKITLENYRNVSSAEIEFGNGVNILCGDNAKGKTNALEAIYLFSLGKSFRGAKDRDLISFGEKNANVRLDYTAKDRRQSLEIKYRGDKREIFHNKVKLARISEMIGEYKAVLFCPEHLLLIKEGPALRRTFMNVAVSQIKPMYLKTLKRYNAILAERNKLIKEAENNRAQFDETIEMWSYQLACEAAIITSERAKYVKELNKSAAEFFSLMTDEKETPSFVYSGSAKEEPEAYFDTVYMKQKYYSLLTEKTDREIAAGGTLYGTHKDDIEILLNEKPARLFASQGQQRSLAISMKLAEGQIVYESEGEYPVFLLDDVLSELDGGRRDYICNELSGKQVIMTTCESGFENFKGAEILYVDNGTYTKRT